MAMFRSTTPSFAAASSQRPSNCGTTILFTFIFLLSLIPYTCCQDTGLVFTQPEEQPIGSFVGSVSSYLTLLNVGAGVNKSSLRYSIFSDATINSDFFSLDTLSGNISVAKRLDRDAICLHAFCEISFRVVVSDSNNFFITIPVKINITDINDNSPMFPSPGVMNVHISEAASENFSQVLSSASDADSSSEFGVQYYSLEPSSDQFKVTVTRNFVGTSQVSLVLTQKLDRELLDNYRLLVVARDGGNPAKSGTLTVNVVVDDVNDNDPVFNQKVYSSNFSEEAGPGFQITIVTATDADTQNNGKVIYQLNSVLSSNSNNNDIENRVIVDNYTGAVTLRQSLISGEYRFLIDAHDMGIPPRSDQAVVSVFVLDTINNQPIIRLTPFQIDNLPLGWVSERSGVNTVVAVLSVEDTDSGNNGTVECESMDTEFQLQLLEEKRYKLIVGQPLDRETNATYKVTVICRDQGSPSLNATASLILNVFDVNDNSPVFGQSSYVHSIPENNRNDSTILVVSASDKDDGENAAIEYRLESDGGNFRIVSNSGIIKANRRFDREENDQYIFHVLAVDRGDRPRTGTATVTINILDVNDVHPIFSQSNYQFKMYENRDVGTIVGDVNVTDPDLGQGGTVTLSLKPIEENEDVPFVINPDGRIGSLNKLDREEKEVYKFYIVATDQGSQKLSSSVEVAVQVMDINDIRPTFVFPADNNFTAYISLPTKQDTTILQVSVQDADSNQNSLLTYNIATSNCSDMFRISLSTGELLTNKDLSKSQAGTYSITINVTDNGVPVLWDVRNIYLVLQSKSGPDEDAIWEQNVLIVACIVCFTVIVSGVVLVAICVVRKQERQDTLENKTSIYPDKQQQQRDNKSIRGEKQRRDILNRSPKIMSPRHDSISYHQQHHNEEYTNCNDSNTTAGHTCNNNKQRDLLVEIPDLVFAQQGQGHQITQLKIQKQEDYHSTSSNETVTGDSGHGTDEDLSNSTDHSHTLVPIKGPDRFDDVSNLWNQKRPSLGKSAPPKRQHHFIHPPLPSTHSHRVVDNRSVRIDPRGTNIQPIRQLSRTPQTANISSNSDPPTERPSRHRTTVTTAIPDHKHHINRFQHEKPRLTTLSNMSLHPYKGSFPVHPRPERQTPSVSHSSFCDEDTENSDLNTTTSGSYSLTPDYMDKVYTVSRARVTDMYV